MLVMTIEKVGSTYVCGQLRLASLFSVGGGEVYDEWERRWGWDGGVLGHHEESHNWEIVLTVNQQPNNMISVAYLNITVRYSLKTRRENRKLPQFFLHLFFSTLSMYCMKALGVNHFKGNWTNKKQIPSTLPSSWLFWILNTPSDPHSSQSSATDKPVYILCHNKKRMDTWKCVFLCVCVKVML